MKILILLSVLVFSTLMCSTTAYAGCFLDGKEYPVGVRMGEYICGADGYWR